jgi:hypothetical protein
VRKGDDLTNFIVPKVMKNPEVLTFRIPKGLLRPVAGKLYLLLLIWRAVSWMIFDKCGEQSMGARNSKRLPCSACPAGTVVLAVVSFDKFTTVNV